MKTALEELIEDWRGDWLDKLGRRADGSTVWQVNAHDLMLLVWEIDKLKSDAESRNAFLSQYGLLGKYEDTIPVAESNA